MSNSVTLAQRTQNETQVPIVDSTQMWIYDLAAYLNKYPGALDKVIWHDYEPKMEVFQIQIGLNVTSKFEKIDNGRIFRPEFQHDATMQLRKVAAKFPDLNLTIHNTFADVADQMEAVFEDKRFF